VPGFNHTGLNGQFFLNGRTVIKLIGAVFQIAQGRADGCVVFVDVFGLCMWAQRFNYSFGVTNLICWNAT
jgi:hypothetical protein